MLFELSEFTAFARSMARHIGDKDKAGEYLAKAAEEANQPNDFLNIAKM
jgi:uncharacterized protein HemY